MVLKITRERTSGTLRRSRPKDSFRKLPNSQIALDEEAIHRYCWTSKGIMSNLMTLSTEDVGVAQHGLEHPGVYIDDPWLECECDSLDDSSISSHKAWWILSVRGLVPGFTYQLDFVWSLEDTCKGQEKYVFRTNTSSFILKNPLTQRGVSTNLSCIKHSRTILMLDIAVLDVYPGVTLDEAIVGKKSNIIKLHIVCTDRE